MFFRKFLIPSPTPLMNEPITPPGSSIIASKRGLIAGPTKGILDRTGLSN